MFSAEFIDSINTDIVFTNNTDSIIRYRWQKVHWQHFYRHHCCWFNYLVLKNFEKIVKNVGDGCWFAKYAWIKFISQNVLWKKLRDIFTCHSVSNFINHFLIDSLSKAKDFLEPLSNFFQKVLIKSCQWNLLGNSIYFISFLLLLSTQNPPSHPTSNYSTSTSHSTKEKRNGKLFKKIKVYLEVSSKEA